MFPLLNRLTIAVLAVLALPLTAAAAEPMATVIHLSDQDEAGKPPKDLNRADAALLNKCDSTAMPDLVVLGNEVASVAAPFEKAQLLMPKIGCAALRMGPRGARHAVNIFTPGPRDDAYLRAFSESGSLFAASMEMPWRFQWARNPWMKIPVPSHPKEGVPQDITPSLLPLEPGRSIAYDILSRDGQKFPRRTLTMGPAFQVVRDGAAVDRLLVLVETMSDSDKRLFRWFVWSDTAGTAIANGIAPVESRTRAMQQEQDRLTELFLVARGKVVAHYKAEDLAPVVGYIETLVSD